MNAMLSLMKMSLNHFWASTNDDDTDIYNLLMSVAPFYLSMVPNVACTASGIAAILSWIHNVKTSTVPWTAYSCHRCL
jgi:hypothetical protein